MFSGVSARYFTVARSRPPISAYSDALAAVAVIDELEPKQILGLFFGIEEVRLWKSFKDRLESIMVMLDKRYIADTCFAWLRECIILKKSKRRVPLKDTVSYLFTLFTASTSCCFITNPSNKINSCIFFVTGQQVFLLRDIESKDVSQAGHEGEGDEGTAFADRHEVVDFEDKVESFEVGNEFLEEGVSYSVLQTGLGGNVGSSIEVGVSYCVWDYTRYSLH
ncbi:unnamed protein product [Sphenostylis stenocarpa]|uniref:Conserved oligomeric Golgi complex subunit 1 n=1 Tax=Sphenostylis stenocarpa TaxID=92480 RepID=A0AA86S0G1_9FABA|nr:unnamed protein product [Sphenostylis stenocarpa]